MTNKQWAIWQMIDMSDEKFALLFCRGIECDNCPVNRLALEHISDCRKRMEEWLKQEHGDND